MTAGESGLAGVHGRCSREANVTQAKRTDADQGETAVMPLQVAQTPSKCTKGCVGSVPRERWDVVPGLTPLQLA